MSGESSCCFANAIETKWRRNRCKAVSESIKISMGDESKRWRVVKGQHERNCFFLMDRELPWLWHASYDVMNVIICMKRMKTTKIDYVHSYRSVLCHCNLTCE